MKRVWTAVGAGSGIALLFGLVMHNVRERGKKKQAAIEEHRGLSMRTAERRAVLNVVSREELMEVYGIGPVLAERIIANRPYDSDHDVVERGIIPEGIFENIRTELLLGRAA